MGGARINADVSDFESNTDSIEHRDQALALLVHLGYLAYDEENGQCYTPNREICGEWQRAVRDDAEYAQTNEIIAESKALLLKTLEYDEKAVEKALDKSHIHITSLRSYNNEDALHCAIYLAYIYALNEYLVVREMPAGKGVADMVYIPIKNTRPALIVELKHNGSSFSALEQIKAKSYFECLDNWHGDIIFVGVNYDEISKAHKCKIERFIKV